jgi:ATP-dependent Clp protease adaptor protein ClpS
MTTDIIEEKTISHTKSKTGLQEPSRYNVIYINDEVTTFEFVVESLIVIFSYEKIDAEEKARKIHEVGSGVVATMPYEMAEQKGYEVTVLARNSGYPLIVKLEADD